MAAAGADEADMGEAEEIAGGRVLEAGGGGRVTEEDKDVWALLMEDGA